MLEPDTDVFLQRPSEEKDRVVHPALVIESAEGLTVRATEPGFNLAPGENVFLYYESGRDFLKQPARVAVIMDEQSGAPLVGIEATGAPESADTRECYRVSTVRSRLTIELDGEDCKLTDISVLGFSAIAERPFTIAEVVPVSLTHGGSTCKGAARVQSVKMLGDGRVRYGFHCVYDQKSGTKLQKVLQKLSMEIQRRQLRRRRSG